MDVKEKILLTVVMTRSKVMELEAAAFREIAAMMDEEPPGSIALPSFDSAPLASPAPDDQPATEASPTPEATTTPEEPPAAPPVPEEPPAPVPAEDPGATPRRRGRPRKMITEEAPSLLPAPKAPSEAEPVEANEPSEPTATPEAIAAGDDDLPW